VVIAASFTAYIGR